jgi:quercetin dioxygenase-like cupin family protein
MGPRGQPAISLRRWVALETALRRAKKNLIYLLEGSLEYQVEGKPTMTLKAGDVLFIPAGTVHAAKNVGSGPAKELATYVLEKGKPPLTLVK